MAEMLQNKVKCLLALRYVKHKQGNVLAINFKKLPEKHFNVLAPLINSYQFELLYDLHYGMQ